MHNKRTRTRLNIMAYALYLTLSLCACSKHKASESTAQKGFATGKVVDTNGRPIAGAKVVANNSMINGNPVGMTDANGNYKIQLPVVGTFHTSASIQKVYNGKTYTIDLKPDSFDEYSIDGAERNFQWTLTGQKANIDQGWYGATLAFNTDIGSLISDYDKITWTLVPVSKLIDGSDGINLSKKCGPAFSADYGYVRDIPIGRYKLTASYKEGNTSTPLKLRYLLSEETTYSTEMILDFEPQMLSGANIAQILCTEL